MFAIFTMFLSCWYYGRLSTFWCVHSNLWAAMNHVLLLCTPCPTFPCKWVLYLQWALSCTSWYFLVCVGTHRKYLRITINHVLLVCSALQFVIQLSLTGGYSTVLWVLSCSFGYSLICVGSFRYF